MIRELIRSARPALVRPALGALLLCGVYSFASPVFAACGVSGEDPDFDFYECGIDGVSIKLTGPTGTVTLDDFLLDPTDGEGYVQVFASDTLENPTDITVNLTGTTVVTNTNYLGLDIRTLRGDIAVNIGADVIITPERTGVYVKSADKVKDDAEEKYVGGNVTIVNYGVVAAGPNPADMGTNGIVGLANAGAVSVSNYGTVTTSKTDLSDPWDTYGILADGGKWSLGKVQVDIYNAGTVSALNDGLRLNSYFGLGKAVNDVDGVITSSARRGVVVWSAADKAEFENYGSVTALDGTGINIWGDQGASAINSGDIFAFDNPNATGGTSNYVGAHIWAQTTGDAVLNNLSGGSIVARDGFGAWMQSTDGDVIVGNAGLIKGQYNALMITGDDVFDITGSALEEYKGAQGGDVTVRNTGVLTAFGLAKDGIANRALVTIAGVDLDTVTLENGVGGVIGAGLDLDNGFDTSLLDGSASDLAGLSAALSNSAVLIGANADQIDIINRGTILGRMTSGQVLQVFGEGPNGGDDGYFFNYGLWATSGESELRSTQNSGTIWAQGATTLSGDLNNAHGTIVLAATSAEAAHFVIGSGYSGGGTMALNVGTGAVLGDDPLLTVTGGAGGSTTVEIMTLDGWDWTETGRIDIAQVEGLSLPDGEDTFVMEDTVRGLVLYQLDYTEEDQLWSLDASLSQQSVDEIETLADVVSTSILDVTSDLLDRTDELRDAFWSAGQSEPLAYAATPKSPADDAIAGALAADGPVLRTWARVRGAVGGNDEYSGQQGTVSFGADVAAELDDTFVAAGIFGVIDNTNLDYDASSSTAGIHGQAIGAYGTAMWSSGLFVSGVAALETASVDLDLSGSEASFDAQMQGGRVDIGYRTMIGDLDIEPSIGLSYGHTDYDDFLMSWLTVSLDDADTIAAEARLRVSKTYATEDAQIAPFAILSLGNRSVDDGLVTLSEFGAVGTLEDGGIYGGVSGGLQVTSLDGALSGFARADVKASEQSVWTAVKIGGAYRF